MLALASFRGRQTRETVLAEVIRAGARAVGVAAVLLLAAQPLLAVPVLPPADRSLQAYVVGRVAAAERDHDVAARAFGQALRSDASDEILQARAFESALQRGDRAAAVRLAQRMQGRDLRGLGMHPVSRSAVALVPVAEAARRGSWRAYEEAVAAFTDPLTGAGDPPIIATILRAHGLAARGRTDAALELLEAPGAQPVTRAYFGEHRAHVLALAQRWPEAAEAYRALVEADGVGAPRMRVAAAAAALEASRQQPEWRERAIRILGSGPADDPVLADARQRLIASPRMAGRELGLAAQRPADAVGLLFLRLATDLARDRNPAPSLAFARLATFAAPGIPETWLVTADTLGRQEQVALALEALDNAPQAGPLRRATLWRRAALLAAAGDHEAARTALRPLVDAPDATVEDWVRLADVDRMAEHHAGTIESMSRAIALLGDDVRPEHGYLFFLRGAAHEQADRFAEAEADLRRALELQPDNAIYLNYLGYSLLDRGLKLDEAEALIARAFAAEPENGAIIDSMGWAAFMRGRYEEAVELLEKARAAEPADPTIADHLGDALWRVGRRIEARHAWAAARALDPPEKLGNRIDLKLAYGLDAALAAR